MAVSAAPSRFSAMITKREAMIRHHQVLVPFILMQIADTVTASTG